MKQSLFALALACGLPVIAQTVTVYNPGGASLAGFPSTAPGWTLDFNTMALGNLDQVTLQVYGVKRYRECDSMALVAQLYDPGCFYYNVRTDFISRIMAADSGITLNSPILIDQAQALTLGVTQAQLDAYFGQDPDGNVTSTKLYKAYVSLGTAVNYQYTKQGSLVLMVDVPQAGSWRLRVNDSHFQIKSAVVTVPSPGVYGFQVNNVNSGNVRVDFMTHTTGAYFRQEPMVVRPFSFWLPSVTAGAGIRFVTNPNDSRRVVIKHLSVGQGSQDENGSQWLEAGKDAMVRVMIQDSKGEFSPGLPPLDRPARVLVQYGSGSAGPVTTTLNLYANAQPVVTGALDNSLAPPLVIPGSSVSTGLWVSAKLLDAAGAVVDEKLFSPAVTQGPTLVIHPYSIRPVPYGSPGFDYVTNEADFLSKVGRWAEERFPVARLLIRPVQILDGVRSLRAPWEQPQPNDLLDATLGLMNLVAQRMGYRNSFQRHIFVGIMHPHYYVAGAAGGMAKYGQPGIAMYGQELGDATPASGQIFTHEMGHCFNLRHTPSVSFNGIVASDPDPNYPYSGNGLTVGYAFSPIYQFFNREISQNWDHMSYWGNYDNRWRFFSDYNFRSLQSQMGAAGVNVNFAPTPMNLPKTSEGAYIWGKAELEDLKHWVNVNLHKNDVCEMPVASVVVGEQGQFLKRISQGVAGDLLLPAFDLMGPMSLTLPSAAPIFEPNLRGGRGAMGGGAMDCWTHCTHAPKNLTTQHSWMTVSPEPH